jgi:hypothetical protein
MLLLRQLVETATAVTLGVINTVMRTPEKRADLKPGDRAPDFSLTGSDGRTYRLRALQGRPVVIAWFPKAFTGG